MTTMCHRPVTAHGRAAGFTLPEMLLVVALIALASILAAPSLVGPPRHAIVERQAIELANRLTHLRARARTTATSRTMIIDVTSRSIRDDDGDAAKVLPDWIAIEAIGQASVRTSESEAVIGFFPDGSTTGARVRLYGGGRRSLVEVDWLTGAVSIRHDGGP